MRSCKLGPQFLSWLRWQTNFSIMDISANNISDLSFFNLSFNKISRSIPNLLLEFDYCPVIVLDLSINMFSEPLSFLCMKINNDLIYFDLSYNLLIGGIPDCWKKYKRLTAINLEKNNLSGVILNNKLIGIIPPWIGERLERLIVLHLRLNEFCGNAHLTLSCQQFLQVLDLSLNNISGDIPSCLNNLTAMAHFGSSMETISIMGIGIPWILVMGNTLRTNKFARVDKSESFKKHVEDSLDLSTNNLSGEIPKSMSELSFLSVLDLSNNNLSRKILSSTQLQSFNAISYSGNLRLCREPLSKFLKMSHQSCIRMAILKEAMKILGTLVINKSWRHKYFQSVNKLREWIRLRMALIVVKLQRKLGLKE
ncbi:LRR receptor-like serine/threonine-protein kinase ERECTA [Gossypium australe]|uniref:LRR receptor-like serine/threonine-protein kinase ERECTA n=1 Tax=Gossypium australe TaxID=47621 RepID=A0A5B6VII1_9ROSI|nr:LRR receptor-like serine/threonine-protein kinase ERECTA [Gossypium australe]